MYGLGRMVYGIVRIEFPPIRFGHAVSFRQSFDRFLIRLHAVEFCAELAQLNGELNLKNKKNETKKRRQSKIDNQN